MTLEESIPKKSRAEKHKDLVIGEIWDKAYRNLPEYLKILDCGGTHWVGAKGKRRPSCLSKVFALENCEE